MAVVENVVTTYKKMKKRAEAKGVGYHDSNRLRRFVDNPVYFFDPFLFDFFLDESVTKWKTPPTGEEGFREDARNIRGYFEKVVGKW